MAASRSTRVTRSTVGLNGLDENFCGRTLRNRSIAHSDEVVPPPLLRSRSPKKRPEPVQIQKGSLNKGSELKQPGPRESWVSPRKRGLSISDKDSCDKDSVENSDRKSSGALSPVLKKIKRYLCSEEPNSPGEESPGTFHKEPSERRNSGSDHETDAPRAKRANRYLLLDDSNQREIKTESEEIVKKLPDGDACNHQIVNGIDNNETAAVNCNNFPSGGSVKQNNTSTVTSSKESNLSENGSSGTPRSAPANSETDSLSDHNVPCTHSEEQAGKQDHELNNCLPIDYVSQTNESAGASCSEALLIIRDSEEELDVVGDGISKEQAAQSPYSVPKPSQDRPVRGEDFPTSEVAEEPSLELCFSDTQEHRYTLRTSPRKVVSVKDSSSKNASPWGENGQAEESSIEGSRLSSAVNGSVTTEEAAPSDRKQMYFSAKCSQDRPAASSSTECTAFPARESGGVQPAEEEEDEPDVYFFESDHVALKHNKDYQRLLQTISVLEAQRSQAVVDIETLAQHQKDALDDPIGFVEKLQTKMDIGIPRPQRIVQLPEISWDQYTSALGNFEREFRNRKRNSRRVKLIFDKAGLHSNSQRSGEKDGEPSCYSVLPQSDCPESSAINMSQVRGRLCMDSKPGTFNQLWTVEEQKKLEQLLLKYPPEEVEAKRWQKIAEDLGNRTAKQVASRVQKYFIKLTKAGIPVPGRTPNLYMYSKKPPSKRQHVLNKHLFKPSTFMTSHEPPVFMEEDDDHSSFQDLDTAADEDDEVSDEESIPAAYHSLPEYKELLELKKLKKQRLQEMEADSGFLQHVGFTCDNCGTDPIQGIRWHCQDCPPQMSVDFCDSCSDCLFETETHKEDHHLEPVYKVETFLDRDYCMPHGTSYNYLDPNYFPANR